ncbi:MAG: nitrous oxide reductase family maturation protein NosD [Promethearchaeota archaeon]
METTLKWSIAVLIVMLFIWLSVDELSQELPFTPEDQFSDDQAAHPRMSTSKIHQFNPHEPIIIEDDYGFDSQGFPGSGTIDDPYRIEGFNITSSNGTSIVISRTENYFCIRNNFLHGLSSAEFGIEFSGVEHGTIENNIVTNYSTSGITLRGSNNNVIINNTITNNDGTGIYLQDSENNTISNNTISNNDSTGIFLDSSVNNFISDNSVFNNDGGIYLWKIRGAYSLPGYNIIVNNFIANNEWTGISIYDSASNTILDNILMNNGFQVQGGLLRYFFQTEVRNNTINGRALIYWQNIIEETVPRGAGQIILVNCTAVTVTNQNLSDVETGLGVISSDKLSIFNNTIVNNCDHGIHLWDSTANSISRNTVSHNGIGIYLENSYSSTISNNIFSHNGVGIYHQESENSVIFNNTFSNNHGYGISILDRSSFCNVSWNIFIGNNPNGTSQAYDASLNNTFNQNYWDDWVGDDPYPIDGVANNRDRHPQGAPNRDSASYWSENILVGFFLFVVILPVLGILIRRQKRNF